VLQNVLPHHCQFRKHECRWDKGCSTCSGRQTHKDKHATCAIQVRKGSRGLDKYPGLVRGRLKKKVHELVG
jgi:hypothetical protein